MLLYLIQGAVSVLARYSGGRTRSFRVRDPSQTSYAVLRRLYPDSTSTPTQATRRTQHHLTRVERSVNPTRRLRPSPRSPISPGLTDRPRFRSGRIPCRQPDECWERGFKVPRTASSAPVGKCSITIDRITHAVAHPVSADVDAGDGATPEAVAEVVRGTVEAGAIGVSLKIGR